MIKKGLYLVLALFLVIFAGYIFAQSNSKDQQSYQTGQTIKGFVAAIDLKSKRVIIQDDETHQKKTFIYNDRTLWRNPVTPGKVTDMQTGSHVVLKVNDNTIVRADIFPARRTTENTPN